LRPGDSYPETAERGCERRPGDRAKLASRNSARVPCRPDRPTGRPRRRSMRWGRDEAWGWPAPAGVGVECVAKTWDRIEDVRRDSLASPGQHGPGPMPPEVTAG